MQSCSLSSLLFAGWTGPYRRAAQGLLLALCSGIPLPLPPFLAEGGRSMARWLQRACPESVRSRVQPLVHTRALSTSSCRWEPGATGWVIPKEQAQEANCKPGWKRKGVSAHPEGSPKASDQVRYHQGQTGPERVQQGGHWPDPGPTHGPLAGFTPEHRARGECITGCGRKLLSPQNRARQLHVE